MITIAALVSGLGWHVVDLQRAAKVLGIRLVPVPFPQVWAGIAGVPGVVRAGDIELTDVDALLVRMMPPGTLEQVVFRMDSLHRVEAAGVTVWNPPRAVEAAVDKYLTLALLERAGIAVPTTWVGQSACDALAAFEHLGGDVVVKPLFGSEGRGLVRVSDQEIAWRTFHTLERLGSVIYLQRMVRNPGYDLRVFTIRGRVLGSMKRFAAGRDWRTNVALGGKAVAYDSESEWASLALSAARAVGAEIAGVDLILDLDHDRPLVLEVNAVPGWRALARVTRIDVASEILTELKDASR